MNSGELRVGWRMSVPLKTRPPTVTFRGVTSTVIVVDRWSAGSCPTMLKPNVVASSGLNAVRKKCVSVLVDGCGLAPPTVADTACPIASETPMGYEGAPSRRRCPAGRVALQARPGICPTERQDRRVRYQFAACGASNSTWCPENWVARPGRPWEGRRMATDRARPAQNAGEQEMLTGWLEHHRGILIWKCEDLTAEQLRRRAVPPSTLSLLGLVRHMAQVERGWFRQVFLGEDVPDLYDRSADEDADFNDVDQADPAEAFRAFEQECAASRLALAQAPSLDVLSQQTSERTGQPWSLRWIVTHMIEEYARHNGHADLLRERVDGSTGDY